jgi:hypothetical protein
MILSRDIMTLGLEYIGGASGSSSHAVASSDADPCSTLRGSLRLLCSQHMDAVHAEAFDKLKGELGAPASSASADLTRLSSAVSSLPLPLLSLSCCFSPAGMLARETWERVPMTDQLMAGVMEQAQAGIRHRFNKAAAVAVQVGGSGAYVGRKTEVVGD